MIAFFLKRRPRGDDGHEHNCIVVYRRRWRDWLRVTYWAVCIRCDEFFGPHWTLWEAWNTAHAINGELPPGQVGQKKPPSQNG